MSDWQFWFLAYSIWFANSLTIEINNHKRLSSVLAVGLQLFTLVMLVIALFK